MLMIRLLRLFSYETSHEMYKAITNLMSRETDQKLTDLRSELFAMQFKLGGDLKKYIMEFRNKCMTELGDTIPTRQFILQLFKSLPFEYSSIKVALEDLVQLSCDYATGKLLNYHYNMVSHQKEAARSSVTLPSVSKSTSADHQPLTVVKSEVEKVFYGGSFGYDGNRSRSFHGGNRGRGGSNHGFNGNRNYNDRNSNSCCESSSDQRSNQNVNRNSNFRNLKCHYCGKYSQVM